MLSLWSLSAHFFAIGDSSNIVIDFADFPPGSHVLTLTATSADGRSDTELVFFNVSAPPGEESQSKCAHEIEYIDLTVNSLSCSMA